MTATSTNSSLRFPTVPQAPSRSQPNEARSGLATSLTLAAMSLGFCVVQLDVTIVNTALRSIGASLGSHRVVFLSSDDEDATAPAAALAKQLGFAPVKLGKLNEGGALVHARGRTWGQLIFQDLFKKEQ